MESPLVEGINRLDPIDAIVLAAAGILTAYYFLSGRVHGLIFMLVLSASFIGTTIPVIGNVASLIRWLAILLLLLSGILFCRMEIPFGSLLFGGYAFLGFVSLFRAISSSWQFQKGLLLLIVAVAIPIAYSNRSQKSYLSTLVLIAVVATIYSILNFASLPGHLSDPVRVMGYAKTAPALAVVLGGLLPFSYWGLGNAKSKIVRIACGLGFLAGIVTLAMSAQRAGTIAGIIGLVPLVLTTTIRKKNIGWSLLLAMLLFVLGLLFVQQSSTERISFLLSRYSLDSGLSNRELIWQKAFSEIAKSPLLGQGTGAAEWVISSSFHNAYLEAWFNTGLLGLVLFIASQAYFFCRILYLSRLSNNPETKSILALALGYMLGFIVLCVFESIGAGASNLNLILYLFLGVLVSSDVLFRVTSPISVGSRALFEFRSGDTGT
jgi:O-antigen ligase